MEGNDSIGETLDGAMDAVTHAVTKSTPLFVIRISRKAGTVLALILLGAALLAVAAFTLHWGGFGLSPEARAEREVAKVVGEVEKLIVLPSDETPIVATITDAQALMADQPFYENAENGDVLLVFNQTQRAILYRPEAHKLINVAPIYFNNDQAPQGEQTAASFKTEASPSEEAPAPEAE